MSFLPIRVKHVYIMQIGASSINFQVQYINGCSLSPGAQLGPPLPQTAAGTIRLAGQSYGSRNG
jgi:hypothetical protein